MMNPGDIYEVDWGQAYAQEQGGRCPTMIVSLADFNETRMPFVVPIIEQGQLLA